MKKEHTETASKIISPAKLAHFVLRTSRYEEMNSWYKQVFGARVVYENGALAFLSYDNEHHRIAIVNIPDLEPQTGSSVGVHHIAFTYDSLQDLMQTYERLRNVDIRPVYVINHGPTTSLYYADPDGNQLELQVENFASIEESTQFFFTEEFDENPIGVEFDPDELLAALNRGVPETELKKRPRIGAQGLEDVKLR